MRIFLLPSSSGIQVGSASVSNGQSFGCPAGQIRYALCRKKNAVPNWLTSLAARRYDLFHFMPTACIPLQDGGHKHRLRRACVLEWSESQILQECYCAFWEGNPPLLYVVTF